MNEWNKEVFQLIYYAPHSSYFFIFFSFAFRLMGPGVVWLRNSTAGRKKGSLSLSRTVGARSIYDFDETKKCFASFDANKLHKTFAGV